MLPEQKDRNPSNFKLIYRLFYPFKVLAIVFLFSMIITSFLESFGIAILLPIFEIILGQETNTQISRLVIYPLKLINAENNLVVIGSIFLFIIIIKIVFRLLTTYLSNKLCFSAREKMMLDISNYYLSSPYGVVIKEKQGVILNNLIREPNRITGGLIKITAFLTSLFTITFYYGLLLLTNVKITVFLTIGSVFIYLFISFLTKKYSMKYGEQEVAINQEINAIGAESISALRQIKTFSIQSKVTSGFKKNIRKLSLVELKKVLFLASPRLFIEFIFFSGIIITIVFIYLTSIDLLKTIIPALAVFVIVSQRLLGHLSSLIANKIALDHMIPAFLLVGSLIEKNEVLKVKSMNRSKFDIPEADIVFDDVTFAYDDKKPVFSNFNFSIPKGKITAIIGDSGSGKSTIADLVLALTLPNTGKITLNGISINDIDIIDWRKKIGFVSQDNFLFHTSIIENIRFGNLEASDEMIINAAKNANAHDFILEFPEGYKTVVGDRGMLVSGGQKQRIAIARALVRDPEILIFDEATSALDYKTERELQKVIFNVSKGKTVLIISHRLETVKNADNILKIENGKISNINFQDIQQSIY